MTYAESINNNDWLPTHSSRNLFEQTWPLMPFNSPLIFCSFFVGGVCDTQNTAREVASLILYFVTITVLYTAYQCAIMPTAHSKNRINVGSENKEIEKTSRIHAGPCRYRHRQIQVQADIYRWQYVMAGHAHTNNGTNYY